FNEAIETMLTGAKSVFMALIILIMAWSLSTISGELGADVYLVNLVQQSNLPYQFLPLIIFLISCLMSFAMGTSWGTMGIVTPLAIPVAYAVAPEPLLAPPLGSLWRGASFRHPCSPLSDTTILAPPGGGPRRIGHVRTQLPYSVLAAAVGAIGFIMAGY